MAVGDVSEKTGTREVFFELNGEMRSVSVEDKTVSVELKTRPKASASNEVGAPRQELSLKLELININKLLKVIHCRIISYENGNGY